MDKLKAHARLEHVNIVSVGKEFCLLFQPWKQSLFSIIHYILIKLDPIGYTITEKAVIINFIFPSVEHKLMLLLRK